MKITKIAVNVDRKDIKRDELVSLMTTHGGVIDLTADEVKKLADKLTELYYVFKDTR